MGSPTTAGKAARIFVFLAQKAGMPLSKEITDRLAVSEEKKRETAKPRAERIKREPKGEQADKLSEDALARFTLKDVGYVDIKDKETFELAKAYLNLLSKKLGIEEK